MEKERDIFPVSKNMMENIKMMNWVEREYHTLPMVINIMENVKITNLMEIK